MTEKLAKTYRRIMRSRGMEIAAYASLLLLGAMAISPFVRW